MTIKFVYRAFDEYNSYGANSERGFRSEAHKSEYEDPDRYTLEQHFDSNNRHPTPWISTTENLLRAIKHAQLLSDPPASAGVFIAVISLAACGACEYERADDLDAMFDLEPFAWHREELVFRWAIPARAVVCCLALDTLERRGLYTVVPELDEHATVNEWRERIAVNWRDYRPDRDLAAVGCMAARFAFLFGDGPHTEYVGLEVAGWWENRVARIVKRSLYEMLDQENDTPECFEG